jgi:hypothetical protein
MCCARWRQVPARGFLHASTNVEHEHRRHHTHHEHPVPANDRKNDAPLIARPSPQGCDAHLSLSDPRLACSRVGQPKLRFVADIIGAPMALSLLIKLPVHARVDGRLDESRRIGSQTAPRPCGRDRLLWAARFLFHRSRRSRPDHSENRQRDLRFVDTPRPSRQSLPAATALAQDLCGFVVRGGRVAKSG